MNASALRLPRQEFLGLANLRAFGIGVLRELNKPAVILACLLAIAGGAGGAGDPQERTVTVGSLVERSLELAQRGSRLPPLKHQLGVELAQRIEPVLHRHVLHTAILAV